MPSENSHTAFGNHSNEPVPDEESVGGIKIATIIVGVAITLPAFLVGSEVLYALGTIRGAVAILSAGAILTVLGTLIMSIGARSRLSTYNILQFPFGVRGARPISLLLAITLFGWFGVTATLFGQAVQIAVERIFEVALPVMLFTGIGSALMVVTTIYGFTAIQKLSTLSVPLMLVVLFGSIYEILSTKGWSELLHLTGKGGELSTIGIAMSAVVGAFIVGVTIASDMSRFSKNARAGIVGALLSYGSVSLLILIAAGMPSLVTGDKNLMENFHQVGLGLPALFIMMFATWTTNTNNLYSASLAVAQILPRVSDWQITLVSGVLGTIVALGGIAENFVRFLLLLGVAVPPLAGIFITDFWVLKRRKYALQDLNSHSPVVWHAFGAWACGTLTGALASGGVIQITTIPACDAIVVASLAYWLLSDVARRLGSSKYLWSV